MQDIIKIKEEKNESNQLWMIAEFAEDFSISNFGSVVWGEVESAFQSLHDCGVYFDWDEARKLVCDLDD